MSHINYLILPFIKWLESYSIGDTFDNKEFSKTEFEITHNSIGKLFSDSLGEADKIAIKDQNHFDETSIYDMIRNRENARIERKSAFLFDNKNNTRNKHLEKSISKAIQGFANSYDGGILFIGVDNNGNIIGLKNDYSPSSSIPC